MEGHFSAESSSSAGLNRQPAAAPAHLALQGHSCCPDTPSGGSPQQGRASSPARRALRLEGRVHLYIFASANRSVLEAVVGIPGEPET